MTRSEFIRECAIKIVRDYNHIGESVAAYTADRALVEAAWRADGLVACGVLIDDVNDDLTFQIGAARQRIKERHP